MMVVDLLNQLGWIYVIQMMTLIYIIFPFFGCNILTIKMQETMSNQEGRSVAYNNI